MFRPVPVLLIALALLVAVGCGQAATDTPSPAASASAAGVASPGGSAPAGSPTTPGATSSVLPSGSGPVASGAGSLPPGASPGPSGSPAPGTSAGGSPVSSPAVPASRAPGASATPRPGATAGSTPRPGGSSPRPTFPADLSTVEDLRDLLPGRVGEYEMGHSLYTGEDFEAAPASISDQMKALLKSLGRTPGDLTMAVAAHPRAETDLSLTAFRVRDTDAKRFFDAYVPLITESFPDAVVAETVLGGRTVYDVSLDGVSVGTTFLYPRDDVLFIVTGTDLALVDEAFAALP